MRTETGRANETRQRALDAVMRAIKLLEDSGDREAAQLLAQAGLLWKREWR